MATVVKEAREALERMSGATASVFMPYADVYALAIHVEACVEVGPDRELIMSERTIIRDGHRCGDLWYCPDAPTTGGGTQMETSTGLLAAIREQAGNYWERTGEHWQDGGLHHRPGKNLGRCKLCFDAFKEAPTGGGQTHDQ